MPNTVNARDILKKPYARRLIPDEDGGYVASVQEFPGCISDGDTADEALENLNDAILSWVSAMEESGRAVPEPISFYGYSGKIALRLPRGLHKRSAELAASEGVSLNQLLVSAIASYVGSAEASKGIFEKLQSLLDTKQFSNNYHFIMLGSRLHKGNVIEMEASGFLENQHALPIKNVTS